MTDIDEILNEREKTHGKFIDVSLNCTYAKELLCEGLSPLQREAVDNIIQKLSRIRNDDETFIDHWRDIAGYAMLVVRVLEKQQKINSVTLEEMSKNFRESEDRHILDTFKSNHEYTFKTQIPTDQCELEKDEPKKYELRKYYAYGDPGYESISVDKEVFIHTLNNYSNSKGNKHTLDEDEEHGPYLLCLWMYEKYCPDHIKEKYKINIIYENKYNEDEKEDDFSSGEKSWFQMWFELPQHFHEEAFKRLMKQYGQETN